MHLETLLYMLLQSDRTRPPAGVRPDFESMAKHDHEASVPNEWIKLNACHLRVGMDDPENDQGPSRYFGWDNEKPMREVQVPAFEAKARPITNEEFARYLEQTHKQRLPASWVSDRQEGIPITNGHSIGEKHGVYMNGLGPPLTDNFVDKKYVRTVYGLVPLRFALHWPVFASYDELAACAAWMNGRIPTADEVRVIYENVDVTKAKEIDSILTRKISAVNG